MRIGTGESCGPGTILGWVFGRAFGVLEPPPLRAPADTFEPASWLLFPDTTSAPRTTATTSTTGTRNRIAGRGYASSIVAQHARHYTVEQANAALDWVVERLERLRSAREQ